MSHDRIDTLIRRAIGGDPVAISRINDTADATDQALVVVMAALLAADPVRLSAAKAIARSSGDRQVVEIAFAHLAGNRERVDTFARDHLVDHPGSLIVAWIASGDTCAEADERPS